MELSCSLLWGQCRMQELEYTIISTTGKIVTQNSSKLLQAQFGAYHHFYMCAPKGWEAMQGRPVQENPIIGLITVVMVTGSNIKMEDVTIDATKKIAIPAKYPSYAEKHHIFDLFQHMLQELLLYRPNDPLSFLQELLRRPTDVAGIVIYGPPSSGQNTLCKLIARKLRLVHIKPAILLEENESRGTDKLELIEDAMPEKMASLIYERLQRTDCKNKGWIMEGYPRTREQALALQGRGILLQHLVHLDAPDAVLIERYAGKRVDSVTGDVYHIIFNPPNDPRVSERLVEEKGGTEFHMHRKLEAYHRHSQHLLECYTDVTKKFCCDQPVQDLLAAVNAFLDTRERTVSPHTPRVVLLGPTGSGKSLQAAQLSDKYRLVNIDCRHLLKQVMSSQSTLAQQMKPFHDKSMPIPDDMVMKVLSGRLSQLDCATRGWVLHGFPLTREQAELLDEHGYEPYRVIFLDSPGECLKERICGRRLDPVTGERYHLLTNMPPLQEIRDRLVMHPKDKEEGVEEKLAEYMSFYEELQEYYSTGYHVNAEQDYITVFEEIESFVVNPIPKHTVQVNFNEDTSN